MLDQEVIGLLPAAGLATRIAPLPCSKELYPIEFGGEDGGRAMQPKGACCYLLEKLRAAGVTRSYIVVREGKWDIPAYLRDGNMLDMHLAYLIMGLPFGVPYTLDQAYPFVRNAVVAFGFPDILFPGDDAFVKLLGHQASSDADVILGLFPADQPEKMDMVDLEDNGRVRELVIQPRQTQLRYTWDIAVWTPIFTQFLHDYAAGHKTSAETEPELSVGHVIQDAIHNGLRVEAVPVSDKPCLDIGTAEGLAKALRRSTIQ